MRKFSLELTAHRERRLHGVHSYVINYHFWPRLCATCRGSMLARRGDPYGGHAKSRKRERSRLTAMDVLHGNALYFRLPMNRCLGLCLTDARTHCLRIFRTHDSSARCLGPSFRMTCFAVSSGSRVQIPWMRIRAAVLPSSRQRGCRCGRRCAEAARRQLLRRVLARPICSVHSGFKLAITCLAVNSGCRFQTARTRDCSTPIGTRTAPSRNPKRLAILPTFHRTPTSAER